MDTKPFAMLDLKQRSPEWFAARCGRLTGSRAADMLATIKSGEAAARRDYRMQLVCERLTGQPQEDTFTKSWVERAIYLEPAAFAAFEARTGEMVSRCGFLSHRSLMVGCSLDGYLGTFDAILELKCPKSATHLSYLRAGVVPPEYLPQIHHSLWVSGAQTAYFLSYDDRFPQELQTFLAVLERNESDIAAYEAKALAFLADVDREVEAIRTMTDLGGTLRAALETTR
jgi:putative phage-type endonuclease